MKAVKYLSHQQWLETFKPIKFDQEINGEHIEGYGVGNSEGEFDYSRLETFGEDLEIVKKANPACVWTEIEADGMMIIVNGAHFVNRMSYFVTQEPCPEGVEFNVSDELFEDEMGGPLEAKAKRDALSQVFSDHPSSFSHVINRLFTLDYEDWADDGILVWEPFEKWSAESIVEHLESTKDFLAQQYREVARMTAQNSTALLKAAQADLQGVLPEVDPSGDREHPGWKTLEEIEVFLSSDEPKKDEPSI
jgi:hypothetical protein